MMKKTKILVCWLWNFWYALLNHLDNNIDYTKYSLFWFDIDTNLIKNLNTNRSHTILHTSTNIWDKIIFTDSIQKAIQNTDILVLAVSSKHIIKILDWLFKYIPIENNLIILNSAKALSENGLTYSEEIKKIFLNKNYSFWVFSGWTIAKDLFEQSHLWTTIAFQDEDIARYLKNIFSSENLFIETSCDLIWTECAWAFKNIWSILAWYIKWKWLPYGTETYYLTQFSKEVKKLVTKYFWWKKETFSIGSQCRWNDFWLSCTGNTRNREFWELLWHWLTFNNALLKMNSQNKIVEWINTLKSLNKIFEIRNINRSKFPLLSSCISFLTDNFILKINN